MTRLTEKYPNFYAVKEEVTNELGIDGDNEDLDYITTMQQKLIQKLCAKLGKLEDLEEQLGCHLEVLGKARKNKRIFLNRSNKYVKIIDISIYGKPRITYLDGLHSSVLFLTEYKKSWWLKKDGSE